MIAGLDEAGRGPVLGSMVISGVTFRPEVIEELKTIGVKDSKLLSPMRRSSLAELILEKAEKFKVIELSPAQMDELRLVKKIKLNQIEAIEFAHIIDYLKPAEAYIDSADVKPERFANEIQRHLRTKTKLIVEHYADRKYPQVSAASILAKVRRDQCIEELKKRYGDLGSGYSSDPRTIRFLERWVKKHGKLPKFARKSWETARRIQDQITQKKLE